MVELGFDTNFTIQFDSDSQASIQFPIRFNIDDFGYIAGTVHVKFSKRKKQITTLL